MPSFLYIVVKGIITPKTGKVKAEKREIKKYLYGNINIET